MPIEPVYHEPVHHEPVHEEPLQYEPMPNEPMPVEPVPCEPENPCRYFDIQLPPQILKVLNIRETAETPNRRCSSDSQHIFMVKNQQTR